MRHAAVILGFIMLAGSAEAQIVYQTGFESPEYAVGGLVGQNGWLQFGGATSTVQTDVVKSGLQAMKVDGSAVSGQTGPYLGTPTALTKVSLSADILLTSGTSAPRAWQFAALGDGLVGFSGGIDPQPNGDFLLITNGFPALSGFTRDVWHNVDIRLDYGTQTWSLRLDGAEVASNLAFCGSNGACTNAFLPGYVNMIFDTFGSLGDDAGYLDNLIIQGYSDAVVPEPASWAMLISGFGLVGLAARRRRISGDVRAV